MILDNEGYELNEEHERVVDDAGEGKQVAVDDEGYIVDTDEAGEITRRVDEEGKEISTEVWTPETPPAGEPPAMTQEQAIAELEKVRKQVGGLTSDLTAERERRRGAESQIPATPRFNSQEEYDEYMAEMTSRKDVEPLRKQVDYLTDALDKMLSGTAKKGHEDYDDVVAFAKDLIAKNPSKKAAIDYSDNPFEALYTLGQTHPDYLQAIKDTAKEEGRKEITEKIKPHTSTAAKAKGGGGGEDFSDLDVAAAIKLQRDNPEAFARLPENIRIKIMGGR